MLAGCTHKQPPVEQAFAVSPLQTLTINTPGEEAANCVLYSGRETYSMQAPGAVAVRRSPAPLTVDCFKGAHMRGRESVMPTFAPRDAQMAQATGAVCGTCNYPPTITVPMSIDQNSLEVVVHQGPY